MPLQCFSESLIGARAENQDYVLSFNLGQDCFALVCDGLGGYADGGWASATFARSLQAVVIRNIPAEDAAPEQVMADWLEQAWILFGQAQQQERRNPQAQTTFVLVWLAADFTLVAHAGDSRAYGLDRQQVLWRTRDHNLYELGVMNGDIDPARVPRAQGQGALLYRCVSSQKPLKPVITLHPALLPGQAVALCTDGVWGHTVDQEWVALVSAARSDAGHPDNGAGALHRLLNTAVQRGGARADNASALLILAD